MKSSRILTLAKKMLCQAKGRHMYSSRRYICCCIDEIDAPLQKKQAIKNHIHSVLGGKDQTVSSYLYCIVKAKPEEMTQRNIQKFRHEWVSKLINEYKSRGD